MSVGAPDASEGVGGVEGFWTGRDGRESRRGFTGKEFPCQDWEGESEIVE